MLIPLILQFIAVVIILVLYCFTLSVTLFLVWDCQSLYAYYSLGFFLVKAAVLRPNNLWSTPPIQKSTIGTMLMESLSMLKVSGAWQK